MVFMVRLISGSLLFLLCLLHTSKATNPALNVENRQTSSIERKTKTESGWKDVNGIRGREITDEDIENKVKPFKFSSEPPENFTSIKLRKSESYTSTQEPSYGSSRLASGRSVDIDIEKYISPDFYNVVYTPPVSSNAKDYTSGDDIYARYGTEGSRSYENFGQLTTPRTPYFDKKYKEMVQSVNQKLEVEPDVENLTHPANYTSDNFIENIDQNPNGTKVVYKIFENIGMNESENAGGGHRDLVLETQTILSFERLRNETMTYDERTPDEGSNRLRKDNLKYLMGEQNTNEVKEKEVTVEEPSFSRTNFQLTTRKYSITKPPTDKNDAGIISNKIESDSLKSLVTTTAVPTSDVAGTTNWKTRSSQSKAAKRGSVKFIDYQKMSSSTISPSGDDQVPEQIYQENQIIPVNVASPPAGFQTTTPRNVTNVQQVEMNPINKAEETTINNENISVRNNTIEPEEQQSTTVLVIVQPDEPRNPSTESNFIKETTVSIASTPRGFSLPTTEILEATTDNEFSTTFLSKTEFEETTATDEPMKMHLDSSTTERKYITEEATSEDITTIHSKTLEPEVITSITTKYTTVTVPTTTETSTLNLTENPDMVFSTTDQSSTAELLTDQVSTTNPSNVESPASTFSIFESITDGKPTTQSSMITEKENLTAEIALETTTSFVTNTFAPSDMTENGTSHSPETTTMEEQKTVISFLTESATEMNTESSTTKSSKPATNTDGKTTEIPGQTTLTLDHTTLNELRFSKGLKFVEESSLTTELMKDSTDQTVVETTTSADIKTFHSLSMGKNSSIPVLKEITTTEKSITMIDIIPESPNRTAIESSSSKTMLLKKNNLKSDILESKTTDSDTIDQNHTTLFPEKQSKIYRTTVATMESKTTTEIVTTDDATHSSELEGPNGTIVAIVISCVGGVCLIALACLLIVMRNRQNRFNYGQRCKPVSMDQYSVDSVSVFNSVRRKGALRDSKRSYGNPAFEDPVCMSHPLNFPAVSKFSANQEDVHAEFGDIPQIVARTSELPEGCETKNRFANVIPLPESRVFLTRLGGYPNSDYINANYVTGPKNTRKYYIACQAPMSNTVDDFWRMIWEQQCKVILMLTHLFENGSEKCYDYLPPSEVLDCHRLFGDYQVTLRKREVKEKYIISSIQLKNMVSNSWREVTHFWYMGWPEKGVPAEANSIIAFLIEARSYMKSGTMDKKITLNAEMNGTSTVEVNPVVVHCSPGTGRTGTVITCDIAIREFEQTRQVDIPKIVYRIRRDRASAVQTKEQYAFIYKVIALYATKLAGGSLESI